MKIHAFGQKSCPAFKSPPCVRKGVALVNHSGSQEAVDDRDDPVKGAQASAERANVVARVALILACMAIAISILGLFLPI